MKDTIAFDLTTIALFNDNMTIDDKQKLIIRIEDIISGILSKNNCLMIRGKCEYLDEEEMRNRVTGFKRVNE